VNARTKCVFLGGGPALSCVFRGCVVGSWSCAPGVYARCHASESEGVRVKQFKFYLGMGSKSNDFLMVLKGFWWSLGRGDQEVSMI